MEKGFYLVHYSIALRIMSLHAPMYFVQHNCQVSTPSSGNYSPTNWPETNKGANIAVILSERSTSLKVSIPGVSSYGQFCEDNIWPELNRSGLWWARTGHLLISKPHAFSFIWFLFRCTSTVSAVIVQESSEQRLNIISNHLKLRN